MKTVLETIQQAGRENTVWFDRLATIFDAMDAAYEKAARYYEFACSGCEESCCLTRFYHHTLLEYAFLQKGYECLGEDEKKRAVEQAAACCRAYASSDEQGTKARIMCPLNVEGRCGVYQFRPMICRLHGIPHELHAPGRDTQYGPGCDCFATQSDGRNYHPFDRTPFYKEVAELEKNFRGMLGSTDKFRMTIAEMIVTF